MVASDGLRTHSALPKLTCPLDASARGSTGTSKKNGAFSPRASWSGHSHSSSDESLIVSNRTTQDTHTLGSNVTAYGFLRCSQTQLPRAATGEAYSLTLSPHHHAWTLLGLVFMGGST